MKYAILLECDPYNTLGGSCIRDVKNMADNLVKRCHFNTQNIHIATTNTSLLSQTYPIYPTHSSNEIFKIISNIKDVSTKDDIIVLLISGHGYQTQDTNHDEIDGLDEMISIGSKNIIDDELFGLIKNIKSRVVMLSDTCHSGTLFDLPKTITNPTPLTNFGNLISISACTDGQLSMCDIGEKTGFGGSLTCSVLEDDTLEMLIDGDIIGAFKKISTRLKLLNQNTILSSN